MNLCVIPARGGSKRIPRKNIRDFCGKPIIAWSIEAANDSGLFEKVIVSTDDDEIAEVSKSYGAEVPFKRPEELANDYAGTTEVVAHAVRWALGAGLSLNAVCCLYATAPFVHATDIQTGLEILQGDEWEYCFSATTYASTIFRAFRQAEDSSVEMFFPDQYEKRSQDLPEALHDAAQFYWGRPTAWMQGLRIFERHSIPMILPRWRVQDIDTHDDWYHAELVWRSLLGDIDN